MVVFVLGLFFCFFCFMVFCFFFGLFGLGVVICFCFFVLAFGFLVMGVLFLFYFLSGEEPNSYCAQVPGPGQPIPWFLHENVPSSHGPIQPQGLRELSGNVRGGRRSEAIGQVRGGERWQSEALVMGPTQT